MSMRSNLSRCIIAAVSLLAATRAHASLYSVDWMQLAPTPFNAAPPFSGSYNLPGIGAVQMSYSANSDFAEARLALPAMQNGSVSYAGDTYSWGPQETLARTNWGFSGLLNSSWFVTYTFSGTVPAGQLVLGVQGLGRRNANANENPADTITTATVLQNGTYFGDWTGAMNVGPTLFAPAAGSFTMVNSLTGAGGADPWWNTGLAVVRIDDAISSLTVRIDQTSGDGIGVNLGRIVPEPGTLSLLMLGGAGALLRRRDNTLSRS